MQAWRILYMSKDNQGKPIAISGYYAEPTRPPATGNRFPLIALAHGTTGVGRKMDVVGPFTEKSPGNEYWLFLGESIVDAGYAIVGHRLRGGNPGNTVPAAQQASMCSIPCERRSTWAPATSTPRTSA